MAFKRSGCAVAALVGSSGSDSVHGGVYAFGGFSGTQPIRTVEVLPFGGGGGGGGGGGFGVWREVHMMKHARYGGCAVVLPSEAAGASAAGGGGSVPRIAVLGGFDGDKILSAAEVFEPDGGASCCSGFGKWHKVPSTSHSSEQGWHPPPSKCGT